MFELTAFRLYLQQLFTSILSPGQFQKNAITFTIQSNLIHFDVVLSMAEALCGLYIRLFI